MHYAEKKSEDPKVFRRIVEIEQATRFNHFVQDGDLSLDIDIVEHRFHNFERNDLGGETGDFDIHFLENEIIDGVHFIASRDNRIAFSSLASSVEGRFGSDVFRIREDGKQSSEEAVCFENGRIVCELASITPSEDAKQNIDVCLTGNPDFFIDRINRTITVNGTDSFWINVHGTAITAVGGSASGKNDCHANHTEKNEYFFQ
ncbi:MAG: hypothetical protein E7055_14415 [Lentisphaerae bacterium]|nr:hypothetical protein [Lentisphaerota bacterium]